MSDFQVLRLHCQTLEVWDAVKAIVTLNAPEPIPADATILQRFRPVHELNGANHEARLDNIYIYEADGKTYAHYSVVDHNKEKRASFRGSWRYRVVNGQPIEIKAFPVSVREWRD